MPNSSLFSLLLVFSLLPEAAFLGILLLLPCEREQNLGPELHLPQPVDFVNAIYFDSFPFLPLLSFL